MNDHQRTIERLLQEPPLDWREQSFEELADQLAAANEALRCQYGDWIFDPNYKLRLLLRRTTALRGVPNSVAFHEAMEGIRAGVDAAANTVVSSLQPMIAAITQTVSAASDAVVLWAREHSIIGRVPRREKLLWMNPLYLHYRTPHWMDDVWERIVDRWPERWLPRV